MTRYEYMEQMGEALARELIKMGLMSTRYIEYFAICKFHKEHGIKRSITCAHFRAKYSTIGHALRIMTQDIKI